MIALALIACRTEPAAGELSVVTYNVQGLPDPLTDFELPLGERMDRIAPLLVDDDLVGLQEDFDADAHARLVADAPHPEKPWFDAKVDPDRAYGAGLGLLAPNRASYAELHYEACHGILDGASDCLASKGFQALTVELAPGLLLDVLNTHHEAGGGPEDAAARSAQVDQVIGWLDQRTTDHAVLLLGDTNLRPSDPEDVPLLQRYADAGLRDVCVELGCSEDDHIDRFLIRDGAGVALTAEGWENLEPAWVDDDGAPLSDHPPLRARLAWSAP